MIEQYERIDTNILKTLYNQIKSNIKVYWGKLPPAYYEISWLSSVSNLNNKLLFPEWLEWLLKTQNQDGSWGYSGEGIRSHFLTTLQIYKVLAVNNKNKKITFSSLDKVRIWLESHTDMLKADWQEPIGYDLLLPSQVREVEAIGLNIDLYNSYIKDLERKLDYKINFLKDTHFRNVNNTLAHSCEFFASEISTKHLEQMVSINGSLGHSPSATAYLLCRHDLTPAIKRQAINYLLFVLKENTYPVKMFPLDLVESMGTLLYNSFDPNFDLSLWGDLVERLYIHIQHNQWIPAASTFSAVDLDDTMIGYIVLSRARLLYPSLPDISSYEKDTYYATFLIEDGISLATQIHVFWCGHLMKKDAWIEKSLYYLQRIHKWQDFMSWSDKFVPSPWYSISHLIMALYDHPEKQIWHEFLELVNMWFYKYQNSNGSYGVFKEDLNTDGTLEETALVLFIMCLLNERWGFPINYELVQSALYFLIKELNKKYHYYSLTWMGKAGLFALKPLVDSIITMALSRYIQVK